MAEASYEHWGLLHRLQRLLEVVDTAVAAGEDLSGGGGEGGGKGGREVCFYYWGLHKAAAARV